MSEKYVFDSYAVLALLADEEGSDKVVQIITSEATEIHMSMINLGEVIYVVMRKYGEEAAERLEEKVRNTIKIKIEGVSWQRAKAAAKLKAVGGLSYADCFGAALAQELGATLVTGDPEFKRFEAQGLKVLWLTQ